MPSPQVAPINMLGPSAPAVKPDIMHARQDAAIAGRELYHLSSSKPLVAPSACGMPLPRTIGTNFARVAIPNAMIASTTKSSGTNAGFSRTRAYRSFEYFDKSSAAMLKYVTTIPARRPVTMPTAMS